MTETNNSDPSKASPAAPPAPSVPAPAGAGAISGAPAATKPKPAPRSMSRADEIEQERRAAAMDNPDFHVLHNEAAPHKHSDQRRAVDLVGSGEGETPEAAAINDEESYDRPYSGPPDPDNPLDVHTLSEAGHRMRNAPGAKAFVPPRQGKDVPWYKVVSQTGYFNGRLHPFGTKVQVSGPLKEGLGSPGESLQPLDHKGPWPPQAYRAAQQEAQQKSRREWLRNLNRF